MNKEQKIKYNCIKIFLLLLCLFLLLIRFHNVTANPPIISWSSGEWGDPAIYLYNARSYALFHEWRYEDSLAFFTTPGFTLSSTLWYKLFGAQYEVPVLITVISGLVGLCLTSYLTFLMMKETVFVFSDEKYSKFFLLLPLLVVTAGLFSHTFFVFQRVPKGDMEGITLCIASALCFVTGLSKNSKAMNSLAFFLAFLAAFIKTLYAIFLPILILYILFNLKDCKKNLLSYLIGIASGAAIWAVWFFWLAHLNIFEEWFKALFYQASYISVGVDVAHKASTGPISSFPPRFFQTNLFLRQPAETLLTAIGISSVILLKPRNSVLRFSAIWLAFGIVILSIFHYVPLRYRLFIAPPAAILSAFALTTKFDNHTRKLIAIVSSFILSLALCGTLSGRINSPAASIILTLIAIVPIAFFLYALLAPSRRAIFLILVVSIFCAGNTFFWMKGGFSEGPGPKELSQILDTEFHERAVSGLWGVRAALLLPDIDAYLIPEKVPPSKNILLIEQKSHLPKNLDNWKELRRFQGIIPTEPIIILERTH